MPNVIGVRFKPVGKLYYFSPGSVEFAANDGVIVETAKGVEYARVVTPNKEIAEKSVVAPVKPILRKATEKDLEQVQKNRLRKPEAISEIKKKVAKHKLGMKIVDCEFTFDCNKLIIYFVSDSRVDFRELVRDIASVFKIRIELRQIGIRDESKIRGGLGSCGRSCCCSQHLSEFGCVSIKMAKTQGLSLNPAKISGLCGRLMCCLEYENAHYSESYKLMPKLGSEVTTSDGKGMVIGNNLLKHIVRVRFTNADGSYEIKDFELSKIKTKQTMAEAEDDGAIGEDVKSLLD
jgi:cell fate regulator YaaT (PSP1 superfamily)